MRVLLDESLPQELAAELALPYVRTVAQQGWSGLKNGALLERAQAAGFTLFLTADQSLPYQQNLAGSPLSVVILRAQPDPRRKKQEVTDSHHLYFWSWPSDYHRKILPISVGLPASAPPYFELIRSQSRSTLPRGSPSGPFMIPK